MFEDWLADDSNDDEEAVKRALTLRASCEVRMRRVLLQQGTSGQRAYSWQGEMRLFARKDAWIPLDKLSAQSKRCVVSLLERPPADGFRTQQRDLHTNELHYKHFVYNGLLTAGLEAGLGLALLVAAAEKRKMDTLRLARIVVRARAPGVSIQVRNALFKDGSYRLGYATQSLPELLGVTDYHREAEVSIDPIDS